jgi:hypothetical protein
MDQTNSNNPLFDIVIPVGPNDIDKIHQSILYNQKNIIGYRNIYLVSKTDLNIQNTIYIDESIFTFPICQYLGKNKRNGWYFQQLIKLYAAFFIEDILDNYLVIDSDTFFLKPTCFFEKGIPLYNIGTEYHPPYFDHMNRLHPVLYKYRKESGICHHMIFQKPILTELFELVENMHQQPFYEVFLSKIETQHHLGAGASEYEIYFTFLQIFHSQECKVRPLYWKDSPSFTEDLQYDYISCHHWMSG